MYGLYGKVIKYVPDRGYGIILGENKQTYIVLQSWLNGEHIEKGYYVFFVPFMNDRSDYNAMKVSVIYTPEEDVKEKTSHHKKKQNNSRHRKPCNADKVLRDDEKFQRFVRKFMYEQKALKKEREKNHGNTYQ